MKVTLTLLLLMLTGAAQAAPGDIVLDLGIGLHYRNKSSYLSYGGVRVNPDYPSFDQSSNPIALLDLSYQWTERDFVGWLHNSSLLDRDANYGFNMIYYKRRFTFKWGR